MDEEGTPHLHAVCPVQAGVILGTLGTLFVSHAVCPVRAGVILTQM